MPLKEEEEKQEQQEQEQEEEEKEKDIENQLNTNNQVKPKTYEKNVQTVIRFRKPDFEYSFEEMEGLLSTTYDNIQNNNSTICDIIAIYLKGQKILYTEAKTLCEQRLTSLMLPAIFFTVVCTITNLLLKDFSFGPLISSLLNGLVAFILAIVSYLKLDARSEAHRTSAYKFDKLISYVEFNSGKVFFIEDEYRKLPEIISYVENNVKEIKETNQFVLPEKIRFLFPNLTSINVFAEVKRRQNKEAKIILDITKLANNILEMEDLIKKEQNDNKKTELLEEKIALERRRERREEDFYSVKNDLLNIDSQFEVEMEKYREYQLKRFKLTLYDYFKV
jgi:cell division protein ZapA (FtsZ GTPase activity inhibitor)